MKIDLFDMNEFIELNHLQEVTSPVLFERGGFPHPEGLVSNEIFGINIKSRKETYAYINLHGHFMHPHIYKIIKRVFRNIDKIVNGEEYYSIDKEGHLIRDENGETGIEFLYDNWSKIKWDGNGGMSTERTNLIQKTKKNYVWMDKYLVIPAFYRDNNSAKGGGGETHKLNDMYVRLLRMANLLSERDMFSISFHATNYSMQNTLVDIYDYFKDKLDKKSGLIRKYLLGKNVDFCVRTVISAPCYNQDRMEDRMVDFEHCAIPLAQVCVLCYPFVIAWLKNFFERELIESKYLKFGIEMNDENHEMSMDHVKNPEAFYNDKFIKKAVDQFVSDPSSRFDKIPVPMENGREAYLVFSGKIMGDKAEASPLINRYMTWTDLLYICTCEITTDKHAMVTRYPILDNFGIFIAKIRVSSTIRTCVMEINGKVYKWYPLVDLNMTKDSVANFFIPTTVFSNSYLKGLDELISVEYKSLEMLGLIMESAA